ncbi:putative monooxygenase (luciferase-like) [Asanoa ishikariensis]|uniref:Luciferase family oxidoreductase, group 1 n=1 Tax=Asanoa ishikariensis TaxID=137265 RepID=A0A1H3UJM4_9ACTN|nr:LLM class flavin-dependent oxidoreductase [Asanoa ishikariensis]GIF63349.1 putative monooxygenase (luciferase-like) [Asanoa ishikariensis]SDZ62526.1 luciferase family oxidoreductase, group 1 [Asanoa ishikariensis]
MSIPLSILDLAPVPSGSDAGQALRNTIDLAQRAEAFGYNRYWVAEHHFTDGVASAAPAVLIGLIAAATQRIRVGSGAVQVGHQTALSIVESFGLVDAVHPGRIDLGLGRSGQRRSEAINSLAGPPPEPKPAHVVDGLLIPAPFDFSKLVASPKFGAFAALLQQPGAQSPDLAVIVEEIQALIDGSYARDGIEVHVTPGEGAKVELWILGSSAGQSATVAGERGLPFAANYHVSPATVLEAVDAYRAAFRPSAVLDKPYVLVSADVVVAPTEATAQHLASPYKLWVHSIRTGRGAIPFPTPAEAAAAPWTDDDQALVQDRLDTQFVGDPAAVAERLRVLASVTRADELLVTTITHDHSDRVRSFELLADEWFGH